MKIIRSREFVANRAWGAELVATIPNATVRLHWTDQPYHWHVNDGEEVFVVMDGEVDMHYRQDGLAQVVTLLAGDLFFADSGDAHYACPRGVARVLVIERAGSE
ncbi:cupin domain-containing protein [Duganella sp. FT50W]|uniref:Cupin domain-containing protein n=1 Tax=Duganella lactea TaxID=2692173 RepID=A0A6L8MSR8_9BURK|nr:cupin domain-containing protein [Duganella lactea]MYM85098.1 cupin domain-containing protein [Duganella lactea]